MFISAFALIRPGEDMGLLLAIMIAVFVGMCFFGFLIAISSDGSSKSNHSAEWYEQEAKRLAAQTEYELKKAEHDDVLRLIDDQRRKGRTWP